MILNRWVYMLGGILFFLGVLAARKYFILQTTESPGSTPSVALSGVSANSSGNFSTGSIPSSITSGQSSFSTTAQTQSSFPAAIGNAAPQPAVGTDPTILQHTSSSGGRTDIEQIGSIVTDQQQAYTGDDVTFTVTIKNTAFYKKFVRQLCWESNEGNFGCSPGFNLNPGQIFSISNSGRFVSSGLKSIWVTWTQDNTNFYPPIDNLPAQVQIL